MLDVMYFHRIKCLARKKFPLYSEREKKSIKKKNNGKKMHFMFTSMCKKVHTTKSKLEHIISTMYKYPVP